MQSLTSSELMHDMDTFTGSTGFQSSNQQYSKNSLEISRLLQYLLYFWLCIAPPVCQFNKSPREFLSHGRETISGIGSIFEEDTSSHELCETIGEDLRIGLSDITTNIRECSSTMIDCLEDEEDPLFTKESKESLSMWTGTLWRANHIEV